MNIGQMMKQVQDMQAKMAKMQEELGALEVTGQSGGGMVQAIMSGKGDMKRIILDPKIVNPSEVEVLEDLIVAACNDAKAKMDTAVAAESEKIMGGLQLPPGFKMPF